MSNTECILLETVEKLSLYTTMAIKRILFDTKGDEEVKIITLLEVIENNLARFKMERKWFLATLRDHSRLYREDWTLACNLKDDDLGVTVFNSLLLVVAVKAGVEALWHFDGVPLNEELMQELLLRLGMEDLCLKSLNQRQPLFEFLGKHLTGLEKVSIPRCDNSIFKGVMIYRNLRVLEFGGGVSDKVLCNGLWNVDHKSDKVLQMALKGTLTPQLSLPYLEVLKGRTRLEDERTNMRECVGAAALALQPFMREVESNFWWDTYEAVQYLLEMEAKYKNSTKSEMKLNVTSLFLDCEDLDIDKMKRVIKVCPKLEKLKLTATRGIHEKWSLMCVIIPVKQLKRLDLEATALTDFELAVLLSSMTNLEHLSLRVMPENLLTFNLPHTYFEDNMPEDEARKMAKFPIIKTLRLVFLPQGQTSQEHYRVDAIIAFLSAFPWLQEFQLHMTMFAPAPFLVYGCIGGALAVLRRLQHLSIISCARDMSRELPMHKMFHSGLTIMPDPNCAKDAEILMRHYTTVPSMLIDLQDEVTFRYLRGLKSLEIDELYLNRHLDCVIQALRLSGVAVDVYYRSPNKKFKEEVDEQSIFNKQGAGKGYRHYKNSSATHHVHHYHHQKKEEVMVSEEILHQSVHMVKKVKTQKIVQKVIK